MWDILSRENNKFFITGTDTGIGKTYVAISLIKSLNNLGYSTLGWKPVSSGCELKNGVPYNDDALSLQHVSSVYLDYQYNNPFSFEPPIAPHIAASQANIELSVKSLMLHSQHALATFADVHIVEGVGGWLVPLNECETMADFVVASRLQVILVVGIRLGCINHTLLTYQAIKNSGVSLVGWIANCFQAEEERETAEIIMTLKKWLKVPCLRIVSYQEE